ncbi:hypothetical protein TSOC_001371 [Tetrabaena socialis]|uniref:Uncharacterized protein n=1 Tax=Tetrabaena socialis TaxID=47790 RepID=A0A2J8AGZ4_9CHLO|nr:hypothetical protein TSOC_001371 [Tetrabaena socialis]|eukprot:PNH11794.1 hypothetical protein TSOC_001371 [Tetrabaena socialis]
MHWRSHCSRPAPPSVTTSTPTIDSHRAATASASEPCPQLHAAGPRHLTKHYREHRRDSGELASCLGMLYTTKRSYHSHVHAPIESNERASEVGATSSRTMASRSGSMPPSLRQRSTTLEENFCRLSVQNEPRSAATTPAHVSALVRTWLSTSACRAISVTSACFCGAVAKSMQRCSTQQPCRQAGGEEESRRIPRVEAAAGHKLYCGGSRQVVDCEGGSKAHRGAAR